MRKPVQVFLIFAVNLEANEQGFLQAIGLKRWAITNNECRLAISKQLHISIFDPLSLRFSKIVATWLATVEPQIVNS